MYYPLDTRVNSSITIRCQRLLPAPGGLLVKVGDTVAAEDIIGRYRDQVQWRYIAAAATLKVKPAALESYVTKKVGEQAEQGEVIALRKTGLFSRVCKAPVAGGIAAFHNGHILIETQGELRDVRAMVRGRIANLLPGVGAVVETKGALIRAVWSAGPSTWGVIRALGESPEAALSLDQIDIRCHGAILAAGWCRDSAVLRQADQMQARGIILGSISPETIAVAQQIAIPVILTEGFGHIPMNAAAFQLMKAHSGNEISVLCPEAEGDGGPEIILPASTDATPPFPTPPAALKAGQMVRIIGYPHLGAVGRIAAVSTIPRRLESGALYPGVEVELGGEQTAFVPWMNVEPIA
jgi:hypothetical protein